MKEQGREPMKVAVGQRWSIPRGCENGRSFLVTGLSHDNVWNVKWDTGLYGIYQEPDLQNECILDGGPSPSPEGAGRVMETEYGGNMPARCLNCGLDKQGCAYMCNRAACLELCDDGRYDKITADWDRGARDFPRSPAPVPVAPKAPAIPASCQLERWNETGPVSALEAIQSRPKPEPWVPTVDDWDLLPDAGT